MHHRYQKVDTDATGRESVEMISKQHDMMNFSCEKDSQWLPQKQLVLLSLTKF